MLEKTKKEKKLKAPKTLKQHRKVKKAAMKDMFCHCYCCQKKVQMNNMTLVKLRNERQVYYTQCPVCDTPIYKRRKD